MVCRRWGTECRAWGQVTIDCTVASAPSPRHTALCTWGVVLLLGLPPGWWCPVVTEGTDWCTASILTLGGLFRRGAYFYKYLGVLIIYSILKIILKERQERKQQRLQENAVSPAFASDDAQDAESGSEELALEQAEPFGMEFCWLLLQGSCSGGGMCAELRTFVVRASQC